jgi:hypothetical protein
MDTWGPTTIVVRSSFHGFPLGFRDYSNAASPVTSSPTMSV